MPKSTGSYESVIRGVSQQTPADRRPGQHHEQINFISDPVRGLVRRRGSKFLDQRVATTTISDAQMAIDSQHYKTFDFIVGTDHYSLIYRNSSIGSVNPVVYCFNKTTNKFISCVFTSDVLMSELHTKGVSSLVNIGRYVYIAVNDFKTTYTRLDLWNLQINKSAAVLWVLRGDYSKTFWAKVYIREIATNTVTMLYAEYKTASASYQGVLDTSDLLSSDPDYQKKVNDRNNTYNTALNQWIGTSSADILSSNIAEKLLDFAGDVDHPITNIGLKQSALAAGFVEGTDIAFDINVSTVGIRMSGDYIIDEVLISDSGDLETPTMRAVASTIEDATTDLSAKHYSGKMVKVLPKKTNQEDAYYLTAKKRNESDNSNILTEVNWSEYAGVQNTPKDVFCFATVENNTLYISGTAAGLKTISGMTDDVPSFEVSSTGDDITSPVPYFLGRQIDYLGVFQDRLVIGCDSVLLFSRPGKYLNFFRADSLTVLDNDPVEVYSLGSEDDTIVSSTVFGGNTVLFGKRKQYSLDGHQPITPKNPAITIMASHEDAVDSKPLAAGNFVFFNKYRNGFTSTHQFLTGYVQGNPESYDVSTALSAYVEGRPVEMLALTTPNMLAIRSSGNTNGISIYSYLDSSDAQSRLFDSWSKWKWDVKLGHCCGMTFEEGDIQVFTFRKVVPNGGGSALWYICCDLFSTDTTLDEDPYVDSKSYHTEAGATRFAYNNENAFSVFKSGSISGGVDRGRLGVTYDNVSDLTENYPDITNNIVYGYGFDSYVTPTNPYVRDKNNQAIINGRLTVERFNVSVVDTGGVKFTIDTASRSYSGGDWSGRQLSLQSAELGTTPVVTTTVSLPVGKEIREFKYTIKARNWMPISITAIEYQCRFLYNSRRI